MGQIKKEKAEKKRQQRDVDSLSKQYRKWDDLNTDDSDTEEMVGKRDTQFPVVSKDDQLDWMIKQGITSYMESGDGLNVGMGIPMTKKEYEAMRKKEGKKNNVIDCGEKTFDTN